MLIRVMWFKRIYSVIQTMLLLKKSIDIDKTLIVFFTIDFRGYLFTKIRYCSKTAFYKKLYTLQQRSCI